jgi:hypothetical protein
MRRTRLRRRLRRIRSSAAASAPWHLASLRLVLLASARPASPDAAPHAAARRPVQSHNRAAAHAAVWTAVAHHGRERERER